MPDPNAQRLQCMEIWGGSNSVDSAVEMAGLDAWVYSKPYQSAADSSGGDVYYASSCATGRIHRVLLADVAGHGSAVAETAGQLRSLMRKYVNHIDQKQFVRSLNQRFVHDSADGVFATALVTTYFAPNRMLSICNAGHPRPFIYRSKENEWAMLEESARDDKKVRNIPLGIVDLADYEQFDTRLNPGDLVVCYTDALIESKDASGEMLGEEGLIQMIARQSAGEPRQLIASLLAEIESLRPGNLEADDVTVLILRPSVQTQRASFREVLGASGRFVRELAAGRPAFPDFKLANIGGAIFPPLSRRWRGTR